ncbi:hypothetical protein ACM6PT_32030, partial [Klebsiella pneumoniae]
LLPIIEASDVTGQDTAEVAKAYFAVGSALDLTWYLQQITNLPVENNWQALARELAQATRAELVLSGLALIEAASELSSLRRLCENGELRVEANDMAAVYYLSQRGVPFVGGPALNLYNGHALAELYSWGMRRWIPPVEVSGKLL